VADLIYPKRDRVRSRRNATRTQYYALEGGLDTVTPALSVKPGRALAMVNFEPWYQGGYRRIPGYERFDGRPKPSDATFTGFEVSDASSLSLRDVVTGDVSGTTGVCVGIFIGTPDSIAVTKVSGPGYNNGEACNTGAFTIDSAPTERFAPTVALEETYLLEAEEDYREDIREVPGSGQVRGAWQRLDDIYAIRDNAGATAGILHLASASGWTTTGITMAEYIRFDTGLAAGANVSEGDTLTCTVGGETATIHRIVLHGGSNAWDGSGEGYFVLTNVSGVFQAGTVESPGATVIATVAGDTTEFAFSAGGNYRFHNHNFFGSSTSYRTYGCNGVDPAFEIDENGVVSPILMPTNPATGTAPTNNTPFLTEEHRGHLFLAFEGGSLQHSIPGEPLIFSGFLGAGEFGLGDEITALNSVVGNVLIASTTRETRGLFGTDVSDWELRIVAEQSGSVLYGSQKIDTVYSLDDLGVTSVARSDQFGDFVSATVSQQIQPLVITQRPNFNDSTIVRESNQFRMYFSDSSCIVMYVPAGSQAESRQNIRTQQLAEFGFLSYPIPVKQIYNTDDETGKERTYFVTDDTSGTGDAFYGDVVLLLHLEGTDTATSTTDDSPSAHTMTFVGDAEITTDQMDIGVSSLGVNNATLPDQIEDCIYLTIGSSTDFDFGDLDWTVEFSYRADESAGANAIFSIGTINGGNQEMLNILLSNGNIGVEWIDDLLGGSSQVFTVSHVNNTWHRVLVQRRGNLLECYFDGTLSVTGAIAFTDTLVDPIGEVMLGGSQNATTPAQPFEGYIDEVRVTKGVARALGDYTVDTTAFPDVSGTASGEGFVFEDQIGKNFDGATIEAYVRTAFNQVRSPSARKYFRRADLELNAPQTLTLQFAADLTYGAADVSSSLTSLVTTDISEIDIFGGGGFWDDVNWDEFLWDASSISTARAELSGTGENIGFLIFNDTAKAAAWTMQGITLHYDLRRLQR
jgi:hypothetical protein